MSARFDTTAEKIQRDYVTYISQMRCPHHQKSARVEIEPGKFDTFHLDVFTCCEEFEKRVRESLRQGR